MLDVITIYTDGGARGNGKENNIGAWAVYMRYKGNVKEIYEAEKNTTNNIQELKGVLNALKAIKTTSKPIELHCDSAYVVNGCNEWIKGWKKRGWKKSDGKIIENIEIWKELDYQLSRQENLKVIKVKGHSGDVGNERADELVNLAMDEIK